MAWETARHDKQGVDPELVIWLQIARRETLGGNNDPPEPPCVERQSGCLGRGAGLYLDEGECPAAAGDDVDLSTGDPSAASEDAPAVQSQPPTGEGLGAAPALLGRLAVHLESSIARA